MFSARRRRLLLSALGLFAVLSPVGLAAAACPPRPLPPCEPTVFTASVGKKHVAKCTRKPPSVCRETGVRRGLRSLTGKTGAVGIGIRGDVGLTGADGARGATGAAGAAGVAGVAGPQGTTGATGLTGDTGLQVVRGETGADGATGAAGAAGAAGSTGAAGQNGATGPTGLTGNDGLRGPVGLDGATGPAGSGGSTGPSGPSGPSGSNGATGATGAIGPAGPTGPAGPGGLSEYAYIYNVGPDSIALEEDIAFDSNGIRSSGIVHNVTSAQTTLVNAGIYRISFSVAGNEPSQMALFLNGAPVAGAIYGSGDGTQLNTGQVITAVGAGDVLTLRNHTSSSAVTLQTLAGGTQTNSNASLAIEKIG